MSAAKPQSKPNGFYVEFYRATRDEILVAERRWVPSRDVRRLKIPARVHAFRFVERGQAESSAADSPLFFLDGVVSSRKDLWSHVHGRDRGEREMVAEQTLALYPDNQRFFFSSGGGFFPMGPQDRVLTTERTVSLIE